MSRIVDQPLEGRWIGIDHDEDKFFDSSDWFLARRQALDIYGKQCMKCGQSSEDSVIHVDHIYPRSIYPERELDITNLQILCKKCNFDKSNIHIFDCRPPNWKDLVIRGGYIPQKLFASFLPMNSSEFYPLTEFEVLDAVQRSFGGDVSLADIRKQYEKERFIAYLISHESNILINRLLWKIHFSRRERSLKTYNKYLQKPKEYVLHTMEKYHSNPIKFFGLDTENFLRKELVCAFGNVSKHSLAYSIVRLKNDEIKHFYQ